MPFSGSVAQPGWLNISVGTQWARSHELIVNWTDPTVHATIVLMSASDAAPLPRLGEVFFDVRGNSRSMRLSWYADTDVAVFSIWQGGKCTGTFRLPMDDLSRMIDILQRGPDGRSGRGAGGRAAPERRPGERGESGRDHRRSADPGLNAGHEAGYGYDGDNTVVHNAGARPKTGDFAGHGPTGSPDGYKSGEYGADQYGAEQYGAGQHGPGQYGTGDFSSREFSPRGRGPDDYELDAFGAEDYAAGDYHSADSYGPGDYGSADQGPADYEDPGYSRSRPPRHRTERYEPTDYGRPDYAQDAPEYWPDSDHYPADRTGQRFVPADEAGYGQERFVPPYVRSRPDSSEPGFMDDPEYRLRADPASRSRHSAGRHSGGQAQ